MDQKRRPRLSQRGGWSGPPAEQSGCRPAAQGRLWGQGGEGSRR